MKVRLKQPWGQWSTGHVFTEMPGGQARTLIERNIAEEVTDKQFSSPADRMMRPEKDAVTRGRRK
jgi:hypothetical protein